MGIIKDLWYGRIDPQELGIYDTIEIKEVANRKVRYRSELEKLLNDEQKELLEKYTECRSEHESLTNRGCFEYGFKLGAELIAEALYINNSHNKD